MFLFLLIFLYSFSFAQENAWDFILKRVLENSYKLKAYDHRIQAAEWRLKKTVARYKPKLDAQFYYGYQEFKPYTGTYTTATLRYAFISLRQPLIQADFFSEYKQRKVDIEIEKLLKIKEEQILLKDTVTYVLHLAFLNSNETIYEKLKENCKLQEDILELLLTNKLIDIESVLIKKMACKEVYKEWESIKKEKEDLFRILNILLGEEYKLKAVIEIKSAESLRKELTSTMDALEVENNIDIRILKRRVENANLEVSRRKLQRVPKVELSLSYLYASNTAVATVSEDKRIALIVSAPIYQGGFISADVKEAIELKNSVEMELKDLEKNIELQLTDLKKEFFTLLKKYEAQYEVLKIKEQLLDVTREGYRKKVKTSLDLLEAEIEFLQTKRELIFTLYSILRVYTEILFITSSIDKTYLNLMPISFPQGKSFQ